MRYLPGIRHIRYWLARRQVERHYAMWAGMGRHPVNAAYDYSVLDMIWRGEA